MNLNVNEDRKISYHLYQKSTDTGVILHFRSCAPLQHKKNVIQGTVHRFFNATSEWQYFGIVPKKNQEIWTESWYPSKMSSKINNEKFDKVDTKVNVATKPQKKG